MIKLADIMIGYSVNVQPGERALISVTDDVPAEMVSLLIEGVAKAGGFPFVQISNARIGRALALHASEEQAKVLLGRDLPFMKEMQCYISMGGGSNSCEHSDVPDKLSDITRTHYGKPLLEYRVNNTKWVSMQWPTSAGAQQAGMSTEAYEDFYFDVCTLDYRKMNEAAKPLKELMERTDKVRIVGPLDTDIEFSIKGIPVVVCAGNLNIPDGEIFTAPVLDSVNGVIHYNTGTYCYGRPCDDIRLVFKDGKIIEATGSDQKGIDETFNSDEGARYVGEFALGINPLIKKAFRNTLFDEKIAGSFHFTPGMAYGMADNGNRSKIHWDIVAIQTEEHGGGEMYFDGKLVRKDGFFVAPELKALNPDSLL
jgi:aminopeptidase